MFYLLLHFLFNLRGLNTILEMERISEKKDLNTIVQFEISFQKEKKSFTIWKFQKRISKMKVFGIFGRLISKIWNFPARSNFGGRRTKSGPRQQRDDHRCTALTSLTSSFMKPLAPLMAQGGSVARARSQPEEGMHRCC
ncbi:unnamed protein product [Cuscuta epithymum]|uniref:Uncharacterized protein n=1 Tax=Cuscuta epithymum TaxID=186058 RepID=A0AAV0E494_9ASTE|nr:unnamed protein product [Cuscuta epithymum]CAH9148349.1 unnamed protein product [Cuscuta epithymum]